MTNQTFAATAAPRLVPACVSTALCALLAFVIPAVGHAQNQTWIPTNPNNDWSLTAPNWDAGVPWTNGSNAIFGGTGETVEIASDVAVGNITFNSNGYTIADANSDSIFSLSTGSIITVTTAGHVATISESIAAGGIDKAGAGILLLTGNNTFDGAVAVNAGTLRLGSNNALGSTVGTTTISGTALVELQNGVTISEAVAVGSGGDNNGGLRAGTNATATWAGTISLNANNRIGALSGGLLDITGVISNGTSNNLQISAAGSGATVGTVRISTAATYTGTTAIIRGRLQLGIDNALNSGTILDVDSTTAAEDSIFDLNGKVQTVAGINRSGSATGGGSFILNSAATAATLTSSATSGSFTYSGIIQDGTGVLNIAKAGASTQAFSGNNTYTGTTTLSAGTLTMNGNNTLPGAITVSGGTLTMNGTNTLGAITMTAGTMSLGGSNNLNGSISVTTASLTLSGSNTLASTANVLVTGAAATLTLGNSGSLGAPGGGTVTASAAGRIVLQAGVTISGKTLSIAQGGNNNGALQTATGATATWDGNIITTSGDARIGGGDTGGNLIVNGVISGSGGILYSRANNSTTTLNGVSTYTGDTQLFANGGTGGKLVIGVDNALSGTSRLSVFSTAATIAMTLDLNGHPIALAGADTTANHLSGNVLFVQNNGAVPATLTLASNTGTEQIFNGHLNDGTSVMSLVKNGTYLQTLTHTNSLTGTATLNAGTLQIGKATGAATYTGSNGSLASATIILNGIGGNAASTSSNTATLAIDNLGTSNNGTNRLADTATISLRGGTFIYRGSDQAATNSTETLGTLQNHSKRSILTMTYGGTNTATLTVGSLARPTNGGVLLVNGANLGLNGSATTSVARVIITDPLLDLVGDVAALSTGVNPASKETKVIPGLLGESAAGVGTATGTPNTFLTHEPTTGLRPLDPATEFTLNTFDAGDNTLFNNGVTTTLPASISINSLIITGANTAITIGSGKTLTVASGNILFASGSGQTLGNGGDLSFGGREGIITINTGTTFVTGRITGTAGVSYYGTGNVATNQQSTYSGDTAFYIATAIPQVSSTLTGGNLTSGPFGTGTLILAGAGMRASTQGAVTLHNNVELRNDTSIVSGSTSGSTLTFAGNVSLTNGTRTITNSSDSNTYYTGVISETTPASGITIAGTSARPITFSGANTYTGATTISSNTTLLINGNQSAATGAVNVNAGTLGGTGTLGGVTTIASGATLSPGDPATAGGIGTLSSVSSLTLKTGSNTALQITTATFTSLDAFGGNAPGTPGYNSYVITNGNTAGGAGTAHDKLIFTSMTQETGGKITVTGASFTPVAGQIFNLLDWSDASILGGNLGTGPRDGSADSAFDLDLPDISSSGYTWDISLFATHGIIVVTPEPTRALLLGIGLAMLGLRRRRIK